MLLPNQLTVLRIILTPVFLFLFLSDNPTLKQIGFGVFILAAITDWYDGWLARKFNYITNWGKFMDPLADKILTSTAFFAFVFLGFFELWMVIIIVLRDFIITGLRLYADQIDQPFKTSRSAKWKTFLQMAFLVYCLFFTSLATISSLKDKYGNLFDALLDGSFIYYAMLSLTIFTAYTGLAYIYKNRSLLNNLLRFVK